MRVFNRVVVVLLSLVVIVAAGFLLVAPDVSLGAVSRTIQGFWNSIIGGGTAWVITIIVATLLILLSLLALVLEFMPQRQRTVRIRAQGRGDARLRVDSVAQTLEYRIDEMEGVSRVVPHLVSRGSDLRVLLEVDAGPDANIPALSDQIIDRAIRILEGELGLQIRGRVGLDISHEAQRAAPALGAELPPSAEPRVALDEPTAEMPRPAATPSPLAGPAEAADAPESVARPMPSAGAPVSSTVADASRPAEEHPPEQHEPEAWEETHPAEEIEPSEAVEEHPAPEPPEPTVPRVTVGEAPASHAAEEWVQEDEDRTAPEADEPDDEEPEGDERHTYA